MARTDSSDSVGAAERYMENEAVYDIKYLALFAKRDQRKKKTKAPKTTYPRK